jgi:MFS family permease
MPVLGRGVSSAPLKGGFIAWYSVAVCLLLYLFAQIDRQVMSLLVVPIQAALGIGDFKMGLLMGPAFGLCYSIATFPLAWLADRGSRRTVVFVCVVLWAIAASLSGLARTYEQMFIARMAVGIGEAALLPSAYVLISQLFDRARLATALSVLSMGSVGGLGLALGVGGWLSGMAARHETFALFGSVEPWRVVFFVTGAPCLLLAFLVFTVPDRKPDTNAGRGQQPAETLFVFLRRHRPIALAAVLGFGMVSLASGALTAWMPTYIIRAFGWTGAQAGAVVGAMVIALASVAKIGSGIVVDRWFAAGTYDAHLRYLMLVSATSAPLVIAAFLVPYAIPFLILIAAYFALPYSNMGYGSAFVQLISPLHLRGQTSAVFLFCLNVLASAVGPTLVGWLSENVFTGARGLGLAIGSVVGAALLIAALVLWRALAATRLAMQPS